ncbi:hypothetical protein HPHPH41_1129 [Helicobacter pylori Hp H-41]|nr:hypothetical protein HPHPH41_1650 [Helicobacter pylori Hp H-41]EJB59128.1 hypothetical protein HPHPH41_1708 [Helicobacter pylori Hp H-41]EJB59292.1 hypothetical protein HPHPH41_1525 [Helicobacter pylori Hp H-41]EJB59804.1 hypothetical protein HPHPH41_1129 [Helicobacter pylori Hp H-41]
MKNGAYRIKWLKNVARVNARGNKRIHEKRNKRGNNEK